MSRPRLLAGIDEAGLGPLLGPLAVGYSALRVPAGEADPWKLLRGTVAKRRSRRARLVVADSKRVFSRNAAGFRRLETTVLTFLSLLCEERRPPADARMLLFGEVRPEDGLVKRHPWYARLPELPAALAPETLELNVAVLEKRMHARGLELVDAGVRLVPAGELNASYEETGNKGLTVWGRSLEVLRHLWTRHGEEGPEVTVDLLGGRMHYGELLQRGFPEGRVQIVEESAERSLYVIDEAGAAADERWLPRRMRVEFRPRGEDASFAVALASCIAKYARELVMEGFNAFFAEHQPDLRPTAGYTTDGRRWLAEAEPALRATGVDRELLVRLR